MYGVAGEFIFNKYKNKKKRLPWGRAYMNIVSRCKYPSNTSYHNYGGKGILIEITIADLKTSFYRDKAYLMEWPSIDRIDNSKNYSADNIQWIEFRKNCAKRNLFTRRKKAEEKIK